MRRRGGARSDPERRANAKVRKNQQEMILLRRLAFCVGLLVCCGIASAQGPSKWVEGTNYFLVQPPQPTSTPGKIEVLDVFSYACPACNQFQPMLNKLKSSLPPSAQMAYLPAAFNAAEDWPVFQRGFLAAQSLGIAEKAHDAMYDAVWGKGSLAVTDLTSHRLLPQSKLPTIQDLAKFYSNYGVTAAQFVDAANSFSVNSNINRCEAQMQAFQVDSTPTLIVNGKYRLTPNSAGGYLQTIDLVLYLVSREAGKGK
jgi:thiol:disulfide interchange protein DsbA